MRIEVVLSKARTFPGTLSAFIDAPGTSTVLGPMACLGKADNYAATQHQNPTRDPLRAYGNTPTGQYRCTLEPAAPSDPGDLRSYGPNKRILLTPTGGQALRAANAGDPGEPDDGHRAGLMIHGGAPGDRGGLRPTHGCLRLSNDDMAALVAAFKEPCTLTVTETLPPTSSGALTEPLTGVPTQTVPFASGADLASSGSPKVLQMPASVLQSPAQGVRLAA